jgi:nucleoside 2-deoxyribosyltransferase
VTRLYLAGPMTGYDEFNFPAFLAAAAELRAVGYEVVSPAEIELAAGFDPTIPPETFTREQYADALRRDLDHVFEVDGVALLDGFALSKGARAESAVASALGKRSVGVRSWVLLAEADRDLEAAEALVRRVRAEGVAA